MPTIEIQPKGHFATLLHDELTTREMSLKDLAEITDLSYEHIRKLIRGLSYPSATLVKLLHYKLNLNQHEMEDALTRDRIENKYGQSISRITNRPPYTTDFDIVLARLTPANREIGLNLLKQLEKSQRYKHNGNHDLPIGDK